MTVDRWLSALPAGLVRSRPRLSLAQAILAFITGRADEVEPLLTDAERALTTVDQAGEPPVGESVRGLANVHGSVAMLRAELARHRGDVEHTIQFSRRARALLGEGDQYLHFFTSWNLAVAKQMQGRLGEAEDALAELAADPWASGRNPYVAVRTYYALGQVQLTQGRLSAALQTFRQGLEFATEAGRRALPAAGVAHVGVAEVLYERNELDAALDQAMRGVELSRQIGYAQWLVTSLTTLACIRQALGDQTGALEAIRRPSDSCRARSSIFSSRWRCSERGCCSPRARWTMPPVGAPSVGWVWRMSRATSTSASTFSLRGCCSPRKSGPGAEVAQVAP